MTNQEVYDLLDARGWKRLDIGLRLEGIPANELRLYGHHERPGQVITLVGTPDRYLESAQLANIFRQAGIGSADHE